MEGEERMNKWIKDNKFSLTFILASVAVALRIPSIISLEFSDISNYTICSLVSIGLFIASAIVLALAGYKKSLGTSLEISAVLFSASAIVGYVYDIMNDSYSAVYYIALYGLFAILILFKGLAKNEMSKMLLWIVSITILVIGIVGTFSGSLSAAAYLIVAALIVFNNYFTEEEKLENE